MKKHQTNFTGRRFAGLGLTALWVAVGFVAASGAEPARAQSDSAPAAAPAQVRASEIDHATNQWRALQRGNLEAAPTQPMLGAEASLAYKRYLDSFNSKIPDFYGSSIGQGSGGGGGLGGSSSAN